MDSVPRLPIPDWIAIRPSGLITNSPSNPDGTGEVARSTTRRRRAPWCRSACGARLRSFHLNCSAPRSSASLRNALVDVRLACRPVGGPNGALPSGALIRRIVHLVERELARRLGQDRLHDDDALHAARRALRAARRRIGQHRHAAPAHRHRLIQQRNDRRPMRWRRRWRRTDRCRRSANMSIAVMRPSFEKPTFMRPCKPGRARPM